MSGARDGSKEPVRVLAVTQWQPDQELLRAVAQRNGWALTIETDCAAARAAAAGHAVPVILCDRDLPGQDWREAVRCLLGASVSSCVILTSPVNDDDLWREVVQCGGYEVVSRPLQEDQVVSAVRRAWVFWKAGVPAVQQTARTRIS